MSLNLLSITGPRLPCLLLLSRLMSARPTTVVATAPLQRSMYGSYFKQVDVAAPDAVDPDSKLIVPLQPLHALGSFGYHECLLAMKTRLCPSARRHLARARCCANVSAATRCAGCETPHACNPCCCTCWARRSAPWTCPRAARPDLRGPRRATCKAGKNLEETMPSCACSWREVN